MHLPYQPTLSPILNDGPHPTKSYSNINPAQEPYIFPSTFISEAIVYIKLFYRANCLQQHNPTSQTTTMSTSIPLHPPSALPASAQAHSLTPSTLSSLSFLASSARSAAYAPCSRFRVGAAVLLSDGTSVSGANIENASYPVGTCAERVALGSAITNLLDHGQKGGKVEVGEVEQERAGVAEFKGGWKKGVFRALAVASDAEGVISPCGMCRQL